MNSRYLLLVLLFTLGCASPMKTLKEGNYKKAYKQANNQLKRSKSVNENKKVLAKSLAKIIQEENRKKLKLMDSEEIEDLVEAYKINKELQNKIEKSFTYIDNGTFDKDYDAQREEADWMVEEIANAYFGFGQNSLDESIEMDNKRQAREAYSDFQVAKKYGYKGKVIDSLMEESIVYGRLVYTVEASVSFGISYDWDVDRKFEDVEDYDSRFRKVYFERGPVKNVDCHLDVGFNGLDIDYFEDVDREIFSQRIQTGTTTVTDADGNVSEQPVYETVEGQVEIVRRRKVAEWEVRVNIRSVSQNCDKSDDRFSERIQAEIEEYIWSGDERAIPSRYRRSNNDRLPEDDDMAEDLLDVLYRQFLRAYF
ncbi:MAG: hypothetical protein ACI8YQ_000825 [Polaribacter sp.]|jgi:hypothetical protein